VRGPGFGPADLYVTSRRSHSEPFEAAVALRELNTAHDERDPWLSPGGRNTVFSSDRSGRCEIYVAVWSKSEWAARATHVFSHAWVMVTFLTSTGVVGRSPPSVAVVSIFFTTSCPETTLPNTGCFDSPGENQSRNALWTVLMKN
jgi:hypothetical protein